VHISAIVTIAGAENRTDSSGFRAGSDRSCSPTSLASPIAFWEVLGRSVLDRTVERLQHAGVSDISVIAEQPGTQCGSPIDSYEYSQSMDFWASWDEIVSRYLAQGTDLLLFLRLGTYAEFDLSELVHFHRESASSLTQVCDSQTALDLVLVDCEDLRHSAGSFRKRLSGMISGRRRYRFHGYSQRLSGPADYRALVKDALHGNCDIIPDGRQIKPGVWIAEGAEVDESVVIEGPAYIGAHACICDGVRISGCSNIERGAEVDGSTAIEDCSVLPQTYVGVGLKLSNAVVSGSELFHLRRNLQVDIKDDRLIGTAHHKNQKMPHRFVQRATALISWPRKTTNLSTQPGSTASLMSDRRYGA
jgi:NDP-sugar pyrophosphorylase family protein